MYTDTKIVLCMMNCTKNGSKRNLTEELQPVYVGFSALKQLFILLIPRYIGRKW